MPSVHVPDDTYTLLTQQAEHEDRPIARILRTAVARYCEENPPPGASPKRGGSSHN